MIGIIIMLPAKIAAAFPLLSGISPTAKKEVETTYDLLIQQASRGSSLAAAALRKVGGSSTEVNLMGRAASSNRNAWKGASAKNLLLEAAKEASGVNSTMENLGLKHSGGIVGRNSFAVGQFGEKIKIGPDEFLMMNNSSTSANVSSKNSSGAKGSGSNVNINVALGVLDPRDLAERTLSAIQRSLEKGLV
jgi:hypothetical protein